MQSCDANFSNFYLHLLFGVLVNIFVWVMMVGKNIVDHKACITGFVIGIILHISDFCYLFCMITLGFAVSTATNFKRDFKHRFDEDSKRSPRQIFCNFAVPTLAALLHLLNEKREDVINKESNASFLSLLYVTAQSVVLGDTLASELGTVLSPTKPVLITSLREVPVGTNGGVTLLGLLISFGSGLLIGVLYFLPLWFLKIFQECFIDEYQHFLAILICGLSGLFGSLVDSLLGATLQYSGFDKETGQIMKKKGENVITISGRDILSNEEVNLLSILITSIIVSAISVHFVTIK